MSDQPETIAAVLANYRIDIPAMTSGEFPHPTPEYLRILLDRVEAAYKRERAQWRGETNAAKEERNRIACRMRYEFSAKCRACKAATGNAAAMRSVIEELAAIHDVDDEYSCDGQNLLAFSSQARAALNQTKGE